MKLQFSRQIFEKSSNIKFHENPSRGSRGVTLERTYRQTDKQRDGQAGRPADRQTEEGTGMTKLMVDFVKFAKAHKSFSYA